MTLPNASRVRRVGAVRRVRDVVPLVHRCPDRAVRRHRQALAVADPALHHPQVRPVGAHGHDHRALRRHRPVVGVRVRRAAHVEVDRPVGGDRHVLHPVHVVAAGVEVRQPAGDHRAGAADPAGSPRVPVDLVRLRDVQHPLAARAGRTPCPAERSARTAGSSWSRCPPCPAAAPTILPSPGSLTRRSPFGRPGLHPRVGHPRPHLGGPAGRHRQRARRGQRPAAFARRHDEGRRRRRRDGWRRRRREAAPCPVPGPETRRRPTRRRWRSS